MQLVTFLGQSVLIHFPPFHSCQHFWRPLGHWVMTQPEPPVLRLQPRQVTSLPRGHRGPVSTPPGSGQVVFCAGYKPTATNTNRYYNSSCPAAVPNEVDVGRERATDHQSTDEHLHKQSLLLPVGLLSIFGRVEDTGRRVQLPPQGPELQETASFLVCVKEPNDMNMEIHLVCSVIT